MNKLLKRISMAAVGTAMAVAAGIAIGSKSEAKMASAAGPTTVSVTISTYATDHSWSSGTQYSSVSIDSNITATASATTYAGTYNTNNPSGWRFYESDESILTISAAAGYQLSSITLYYNVKNYGSAVYDDSNLASGTAQAVSGTSAEFTVVHTSGSSKGQIAITSISVTYSSLSYTKPLTANPELSTGSSASVFVGKTIALGVTTTPSDTDEPLVVTSADPSKVTVSGSSSPYTITGVAKTDSPVRVTVAGAKSTYSAYVDVSVTEQVQTVEDKVLTKDVLGTGTGSYPGSEQTTTYEAVDYKWNKLLTGKGMLQFQATNGNVYNNTAYQVGGVAKYIKSVTLICHADNQNAFIVYEGTSANPNTVVNPASTYDATGVNVYNFSASKQFFKVAAGNKNAGYCEIVVELADNSSTSLGKARTAAGHILSALSGKCGKNGTGVVTASEWSSLADTLNTDLGNDDTAKLILKNAARLKIDDLSFTGATIESAMWRYDNCVTKFGFAANAAISDASAASVAWFGNPVTASDSNLPVIAAVAAIGVAAAGGLFFVQRKRRNED